MERPRTWRTHPDAAHRAPCTMKEVEAERNHRDDIEQRYPPDPKAADDIRVHILVAESTSGPNYAGREMQNVEDYEDEYQSPAPPHRPRSNRRHLGLMLHVS